MEELCELEKQWCESWWGGWGGCGVAVMWASQRRPFPQSGRGVAAHRAAAGRHQTAGCVCWPLTQHAALPARTGARRGRRPPIATNPLTLPCWVLHTRSDAVGVARVRVPGGWVCGFCFRRVALELWDSAGQEDYAKYV